VLYENEIVLGDCLDVLKQLPDNSIDSVVTDPPYGLGNHEPTVEEIIAYLQGESLAHGGDFMGANWEIPSVAIWRECFRVLKPGGHLLSFGGTRTWDLISLGLRAAGFENRDTIAEDHPGLQWKHGQGFPKSLNIGKAIDKSKGAEREVLGHREGGFGNKPGNEGGGEDETALWLNKAPTTKDVRTNASSTVPVTAPATLEAEQWEGWGTALKPSWEPILVFRKPVEGTITENVLKHGTGGINIEGTRVRHASPEDFEKHKAMVDRLKEQGGSLGDSWKNSSDLSGANEVKTAGRWPPNAVMVHAEGCKRVGTMRVTPRSGSHAANGSSSERSYPSRGLVYAPAGNKTTTSPIAEDGFETVEAWECVEGCPVKALDEQTGVTSSGAMKREVPAYEGESITGFLRGQSGPSNQHGDSGGASRFFPQFEGQAPPEAPFLYTGKATKREATIDGQVPNKHPTKKPLALMQWLVRLVTPKKGICLDPFCGSGSTCVAAIEEGMRFIGIEKDADFYADTVKRVRFVLQKEQGEQDQRDMFDELMNG